MRPVLAQFGLAGMSAIWPLSGAKRTLSGPRRKRKRGIVGGERYFRVVRFRAVGADAAILSTISTMLSRSVGGFVGIEANALSIRNAPIRPSIRIASDDFARSRGSIAVGGVLRCPAPSR